MYCSPTNFDNKDNCKPLAGKYENLLPKIKSGEYLDSISCNLDFFENKKNKIQAD